MEKQKLTRAEKKEQDRKNFPKKRRWFIAYWALFGSIVASALITLIVVNAKGRQYKNDLYKPKQTMSIEEIKASDINGWDQKKATDVVSLIDKQWVVENKSILFEGDLIDKFDVSSIVSVNSNVVNNEIKISITLNKETYYDQYGDLDKNNGNFEITIKDFKK